MAIISINTQTPGLIGDQTKPHRCSMITTDNLAAVTAPGYLNNENIHGIPVENTDLFDVIYSYNQQTQQGTYGKFLVVYQNGNIILQNVSAPELAPSSTQMVYVSPGGSDTSGNGSSTNPYLTISQALSSITDATPTKRYSIMLGSGTWTDNFAMKANVMIQGLGYDFTHIAGTITLNDPSWAVNTDARSFFYNLTIDSAQTFDFTTQSSVQGKLYFDGVEFDNLITFIAFNSVNQAFFSNCLFFSSWTQTGMTVLVWGSSILGGTITVNSSPLADTYCYLQASPSDGGNLIATSTGSQHLECDLYNSFISGGVSASGLNCNIYVSSDVLPPTGNSFSGGASVFIPNTYSAGLVMQENTNGQFGTATLIAGIVTIPTTAIAANSVVRAFAQDANSVGALHCSARIVGTSFTITSSNLADSGVIYWEIVQIAPAS